MPSKGALLSRSGFIQGSFYDLGPLGAWCIKETNASTLDNDFFDALGLDKSCIINSDPNLFKGTQPYCICITQ